jgi:hypothetical protein
MSPRRWLEGTWYKAVMTYFRVFVWRYWGESQKNQPDQIVSCLRFKPVASKVHVRSVNAQANLMSNSCQGDTIWHRKSLWSFLSLALHGLCRAPVTQRFLFSLIICKSCSKIWAYTTMYTGIFKQLQHTTQMNHTSQNHFWSLNHEVWNLAHITYLEAQTSQPYHRKVTMGWPPVNITLQIIQMLILVNDQIDAQFFLLYVYFNSLHVSSNLMLIIRRINCINTTSGMCHSV